jgi:hypothetical protein
MLQDVTGAMKRPFDHRAMDLQGGAVVFLRYLKKIGEKSAHLFDRGSRSFHCIKPRFTRKKLVSPEATG